MTDFEGFPPAAHRFFRSLERNNNKAWFEANRAIHETAVRDPLRALVEELDSTFGTIAPEIIGDPKRSLFRINRDIRFSKDRSPYKTNAECWFYHHNAGRGGFLLPYRREDGVRSGRNLDACPPVAWQTSGPAGRGVAALQPDGRGPRVSALVPLVRWINTSLGFKPAKSRL